MEEIHTNEQYFFNPETLEHLTTSLLEYNKICALCCPMLGKYLSDAGADVTILDIDDRFAETAGFKEFDIQDPEWLDKDFDIIICDPPFFNVSLYTLHSAIFSLAHYDFSKKLLITYLRRRHKALERSFKRFNLRMTWYQPGYKTVVQDEKREIRLFSNFDW